jgi:hypothetical protein
MSTQVTASCVSTRTATGESKQYMNARYDYYERDWTAEEEELAYELYEEKEFESLRLEYGDIDRELRDYGKHTDRQLREMGKLRKLLSRELSHKYSFVAEADSFGSDTPPPRVLTRKDKRQMKTERRRGGKFLHQLGFRLDTDVVRVEPQAAKT